MFLGWHWLPRNWSNWPSSNFLSLICICWHGVMSLYLSMPVRMKILFHLGSQSLGHCACSLDLHQTSWDPVHRCHLQCSNSCQGERTVAGGFRRGLAIRVLVHGVVMRGMRTQNACMALTSWKLLPAILASCSPAAFTGQGVMKEMEQTWILVNVITWNSCIASSSASECKIYA